MKSFFFKDDKMPYIESRYDTVSDSCYIKHSHDTISIGANEDGITELTCKNEICILDKGSLLLINPNEVHCCNPIEKQARTYHMMFLDPTWCFEIQKNIFGNEIKKFIPFKKTILNYEELYNEYVKTNKFLFSSSFYIEKEEKLIAFLTKLFTKESALNEINMQEDIDDKITERIKEIIKIHVNVNLTLSEISDEVKINQFKIIRLFKNKTHLTPHAYLMNAKINKAKDLIKKGVAISDVYFLLGFFDQSHFIRNFKKIVAVTPKQYQEKILSQGYNKPNKKK